MGNSKIIDFGIAKILNQEFSVKRSLRELADFGIASNSQSGGGDHRGDFRASAAFVGQAETILPTDAELGCVTRSTNCP